MERISTLLLCSLLLAAPLHAADPIAIAIERAEVMTPAKALETLLPYEKQGARRADYMARLAIAWAEVTDQRGREAAVKAVHYAETAAQLNPREAQAHLALAIAYGKMTDFVDNTTKMKLSRQIRDEANQALALDPKIDLAHQILGRWHYGIATLNPVLKWAAKIAYGELPAASLDEAVAHLEKATTLNPKRLSNHHQLAIAYQAVGKPEKALPHWKAILTLPSSGDADDEAAVAAARRILAKQ